MIFIENVKKQNKRINTSKLLLYPTYFSPIVQYVGLAKADQVIFEVEDNYQKQTYRTRCYVYGANGKQLLNIPVQHNNKSRKTKNILIDNSVPWQKQHLRAIQAAYRSSPYFEFYEEEFVLLFKNEPQFLLDFSFTCMELVLEMLQLEISFTKTTAYFNEYSDVVDLRLLAEAKSQKKYKLNPYTQVFSDKYGFMENLSILDLLFMEGPNALNYLENQLIELE